MAYNGHKITNPLMTDTPQLDPEAWLDAHGDALYRYALRQLRDDALAQDAVQETLLAAFRSRHGYGGQATERTWLIAILKHKIVDIIRQRAREPAFEQLADPGEQGMEGSVDESFDETGHWVMAPRNWGDPDRALENKRFREAFELCLSRLSPALADVFALRELAGLSTEEICKELDVSSSNCWVILHRARLGLRQCLEVHWLGGER